MATAKRINRGGQHRPGSPAENPCDTVIQRDVVRPSVVEPDVMQPGLMQLDVVQPDEMQLDVIQLYMLILVLMHCPGVVNV